MDAVIYWIGIVLKFILTVALLRVLTWGVFWAIERLYGVIVSISGWSLYLPGFKTLTIRTKSLELHVSNLHLSVRWLDPTCRRLFKINVAGIHIEYYRKKIDQPKSHGQIRESRGKGHNPARRPSLRKRFGYWCVSKLLRLLEVSVKCLEVQFEDTLSPVCTLIWIVQVTGHLDFIAKPLPKKELGVSVEIEKGSARCYLQSDSPCPSTDDGLHRLGEIDLSSKVLLFLRPLSPLRQGMLSSVQVSTLPLSVTFIHEDLLSYLVQHLLSFLPKKSSQAAAETDKLNQLENSQNHSQQSLPELEVVLEEVNLFYHANSSNRVLSSKLTRVSIASKFSSGEQDALEADSVSFNFVLGIQGVSATDSMTRKTLSVKQILLCIEKSSQLVSNHLQVHSLHGSLWLEETVFWSQYILQNMEKTRDRIKELLPQRETRNQASSSSFVSRVFALPISVVTTVEASDWSVQVRLEAASLTGKHPVVRGVMAACVGNAQWSPVEDSTSSLRASMHVSDAYLHVPGSHAALDHPALFQQRVDDPSVLPSLHKHLWGRVAALGSLTLQVEKKLHIKQLSTETLSSLSLKSESLEGFGVELGDEPLMVSGEGQSLMVEWSNPTVVTLAKVLDHCLEKYKETVLTLSTSWSSSSSSTFSCETSSSTSNSSIGTAPSSSVISSSSGHSSTSWGVSSTSSFTSLTTSTLKLGGSGKEAGPGEETGLEKRTSWKFPSIQLQFHLTDVNVFLYGQSPEPPCVMMRLDAASLSIPPGPSPSHTFSLELHDLLLDDLHLPPTASSRPFLCSSLSNLPAGVGMALVDNLTLQYDNQIKHVDVEVGKVSSSWNTTVHCCLYHLTKSLIVDGKLLHGVVMSRLNQASPAPPDLRKQAEGGVVSAGSTVAKFLARVPLSFCLSFKSFEGVGSMDRRTKVSLELAQSKLELNGGILQTQCVEVGICFEQHKIIQAQKLLVRFPHEMATSDDELGGRGKFKGRLLKEENHLINLQLSRLEMIFPYGYNFSITMDKIMNIKKFLQSLHSSPPPVGMHQGGVAAQVLFPDLLLEIEDFVLQLCDDPFEAKLRANYELMCDEYEQKTQRLRALQKKLEQVKKEHGEYAMSGQAVQNIYDSLELKDSEIYCQRAKKLYSSTDSLNTSGLFQFSMSGTRILAMADPSMLGREKLMDCLKEMDSISSLPEGDYQFSTLWGGYVSGRAQKFALQVRDYPQAVIDISEVTISGRIIFAEQEAQEREKRVAVVEVGEPWKDVTVCRKLPPLKYYYDFDMTSETWSMVYGPSMESGLAQTSTSFGLLTSPTVDPSQPLAYWDKLRLLFHGEIRLWTNEMKLILPTTFNPYNSVEYLELRMTSLDLTLLTNTKLTLDGAVQLLVHTASKYDECELLNFPRASAVIGLTWLCMGKDPNCHHHVVRCAPDRLPVRPDKQVHDSYSAFRSHNLDLKLELNVQPHTSQDGTISNVVLYSSTLRCLQQYQMLLTWNVTRPTRKGKYFNNERKWPRRPPALRHMRNVKISVSLPKTIFRYWSSSALQRGVECSVEGVELSLSLGLSLVQADSDLIRRTRANWTISSFSGSGQDIKAYIKRSTEPQDLTEASAMKVVEDDFLFVQYCKDHATSMLLSVERITYSREESDEPGKNEFIHKLETTNTRILWNKSNRNVVFGLYDAFKQAQELKRYLSTEALKSTLSKSELAANSALEEAKVALEENPEGGGDSRRSSSATSSSPDFPNTPSPKSSRVRHSSSGSTMLDQLLTDINNRYVKYVDERAPSDPQLKGIAAVNMSDITSSNWLISLINTQVVLQGMEQWGYVVASSHQASIFGCDHRPVPKNGIYVSKKSWVGKIQELQYFTTQSMREETNHVPWLPLSVIRSPGMSHSPHRNNADSSSPSFEHHRKKSRDVEANLNALLGTLGPSGGQRPSTPLGEAIGGTVRSERLDEGEGGEERETKEGEGEGSGKEGRGGVASSSSTIQLQRVAPRCHCQVIYVTYGDQVEAEITRSASPGRTSPQAGVLNSTNDVDTFTFRYPSVEVCTTSYQYSLMMDIINNLLLSQELKRKEVMDHQARMKFALQLSSKVKDPRSAVLNQQNKVKRCLQNVREAETALFLNRKRDGSVAASKELVDKLEGRLGVAKEDLNAAGLKLSILVKTFRQSQLYLAASSRAASNTTVPSDPTLRIEVWLDDAHWSLTDSDGQLQLADISLTNFSYNRLTFSDDSGEHRLELGTFKVQNLMPNTSPIYQQVLFPYDPKEKQLRVDKNVTLRVYCKDKAPVAGILVKEHLEVNIVPLTVSLTSRFFQTMQDFFFPKAEEAVDVAEPDHSHLFGPAGIQPSLHYGDVPDGNSPMLSRGSSIKRSSLSLTSSTANSSAMSTTNISPPSSPGVHKKKRIDDVEKMKDRATNTKTFIYIKIPQTALCITYKSENNVSFKDLQNQRVVVPTLEYHNRNWTWTDMLMELKKDYRSAIVQQTIKSAIGMKGSDDVAGLVSPKSRRHASAVDILLFNPQVDKHKAGKGKKLFGRLGNKESDSIDEEQASSKGSSGGASGTYLPPLTEPDMNLKRTLKNMTKISQKARQDTQ